MIHWPLLQTNYSVIIRMLFYSTTFSLLLLFSYRWYVELVIIFVEMRGFGRYKSLLPCNPLHYCQNFYLVSSQIWKSPFVTNPRTRTNLLHTCTENKLHFFTKPFIINIFSRDSNEVTRGLPRLLQPVYGRGKLQLSDWLLGSCGVCRLSGKYKI